MWHKSPAAAVPSETWVLVAFRRSETSMAMLVSTGRGDCILAHWGSLFLKGKAGLQCYFNPNPSCHCTQKLVAAAFPIRTLTSWSWRSRGRVSLHIVASRLKEVTEDPGCPSLSSTLALSSETLPLHDHKMASSGHKGHVTPCLFVPKKMRGKCSSQSMDS